MALTKAVLPSAITTHGLTGSLHIQMLREKFTDLTYRFDTFGTRFSSGATAYCSSDACSRSDEGAEQSVLEESVTDGDCEADE